jgi:hypothetical protein
MAVDSASNRELVVNPGEYAYMQDATKGLIKTHVGPTVVNQTQQEQPVIFSEGKFQRAPSLEQAVRRAPRAGEGDYIVLENPSEKGTPPDEGAVNQLPPLKHGRKVNIPGPCTFALWPGQVATVVKGHSLRSNQYLVVRVYNEEAATKNWAEQEMRLASLKAEAESVVARFGAMSGGFSEALLALSNRETLTKVAEAMSVQNLIGGKNVVDVLGQVFKDTPLAGIMGDVLARTNLTVVANGKGVGK